MSELLGQGLGTKDCEQDVAPSMSTPGSRINIDLSCFSDCNAQLKEHRSHKHSLGVCAIKKSVLSFAVLYNIFRRRIALKKSVFMHACGTHIGNSP